MKKWFFLLFSVFFLIFCITVYTYDFFLPKAPYKKDPSFVYRKTFSELLIYSAQENGPALSSLLQNPDLPFSHNRDKQRLRHDRKRSIAILQADDHKWMIKRHHNKGLWDWITKCPFRSSKAYRAWHYGIQFKELGIPTPEPIAVLEKRIGFVWTKSYFISKYVEEGSPLREENPEVIEELLRFLKVLYLHHYVHRDFNRRNLLIKNGLPIFIDLDDVHRYCFRNYFFRKKFYRKHLLNPDFTLKTSFHE